ncbi:putative ABC-type Cd(2+) transporter [Helianthus annuus]|uniref:ABC-type Cd(2+) transporter n=1 Tax=Helianthus annuus TaxID=4232 RepID=A0A9K3I4N2_HELAN|nr:putative ABC-type Cd(2+) transporter [Helianthus annuus]KAJ0638619.1 putative ABC-type Cd(2+) transporter [Helianthus annuus]KAJ0892095.1 putative ABC-type Cd(2+) transporter [Helianthus annuus]
MHAIVRIIKNYEQSSCFVPFRCESGCDTHIAQYVYAYAVYWNLSTSKLLTLEFVEGPQVNDLKSIQKLGINTHDIARLVSRTFAEMMFKHGFVHCDPHPANLLVRTLPSSKSDIFGMTSNC